MSDTSDRLRRALSEAIAGAGGIILSAYVVYPIDFVKTRLQLPGSSYTSMTNGFRRIIAEEGFLTLYQGVEGELLKGSLQNFLYLFSYDLLKGYAREERLLLVEEPQGVKVSHSRPLLNKTLRCYCHGSNSSGVRYAYKKERRRDSDAATAANGAAAGLRDRRGSAAVDFRPADGEEDESIESEKEHRTIVKVVTASKPLSAPATTAAHGSSSSSSADAASGSASGAAAGSAVSSSSAAPPSPVKPHPAQLSIVSNLLIGIVAGCFCQLFINPLSVIQTRIMTQAKQSAASSSSTSVQAARASSSIVGTALSIWRTEGFSAFYTGLLPAFILTSNPAIQFLVFDRLKAMLEMILRQHDNPRAISALESFVIGAMSALRLQRTRSEAAVLCCLSADALLPLLSVLSAKITATLATCQQQQQKQPHSTQSTSSVGHHSSTHLCSPSAAVSVSPLLSDPYIMAKLRLQYRGPMPADHVPYTGTVDVIASILRRDGLMGLYAGLRAQLLKSVLGSALMFMVKEKIVELSQLLLKRKA